MPNTVHDIVYSFAAQLKRILGDKLSKVILYGSYARGDFKPNSDIDIMILVKLSDADIKQVENEIYDLAYDIELETGINISPIIKNEQNYIYWLDALPFYQNVENEGMIING